MTPTRKTSEQALDEWNAAFRQSPTYQSFMRKHGLPTNGRVKLSKNLQSALEREMRVAGIQVPDGMHIDQGGNLNQKNRLVGNVIKGAAITGAALTGLGAAGIGPLAGLGGVAGATGGAVGASAVPAAAGGATAAGSVAGTAGTIAAAGKFGGSWLGPLLQHGVPIAAGLVSAKMQANAESDAARIQADYLNRALEVEKEKEQYSRGQRADYLARLQPYGQAGTAAVSRASSLLGGPGGPPVRLRAPSGEVSEVPAAQADHYMKLGAVRV